VEDAPLNTTQEQSPLKITNTDQVSHWWKQECLLMPRYYLKLNSPPMATPSTPDLQEEPSSTDLLPSLTFDKFVKAFEQVADRLWHTFPTYEARHQCLGTCLFHVSLHREAVPTFSTDKDHRVASY
jgi:hypothetical protein